MPKIKLKKVCNFRAIFCLFLVVIISIFGAVKCYSNKLYLLLLIFPVAYFVYLAIRHRFVLLGVSFFVLLVTFIISVIVRELLEPRLIGGKMGLWPVAILMSVYVGAKVFGFLGVILGPIYLIIAADWYFNAEISQNLSV